MPTANFHGFAENCSSQSCQVAIQSSSLERMCFWEISLHFGFDQHFRMSLFADHLCHHLVRLGGDGCCYEVKWYHCPRNGELRCALSEDASSYQQCVGWRSCLLTRRLCHLVQISFGSYLQENFVTEYLKICWRFGFLFDLTHCCFDLDPWSSIHFFRQFLH